MPIFDKCYISVYLFNNLTSAYFGYKFCITINNNTQNAAYFKRSHKYRGS